MIPGFSLAKKTREVSEPPYLTLESPSSDWTWEVIKTWQDDETKPAATWTCRVRSPHTYGSPETGKVYVYDVLVGGRAMLTEVDGETATPEQRRAIDDLRSRVPSPKAAGFWM